MRAIEKRDLIISWLTISFAFAWIIHNTTLTQLSKIVPFPTDYVLTIILALIVTGTGFVLHELGHKYMAIHYKAHAEYRAWTMGLLVAVVTAFMGFIFAAPGAVYIYGPHLTRKHNGIISLAGPAVNLIIAAIAMVLSIYATGFLGLVLMYTAMMNLFLALFNMIPIFPLDGSKVMAWNVGIWAIVFFPLLLWYVFL